MYYRIDKTRKTVLGMRIFNFNNGRPDGRYTEIQGQSRVTFFKNGTVKYLKYGRYNDRNRLNRFEFYDLMNKIDMNGKLYAKCSVVSTRKVSSREPSTKTPNSSSSKSKNNNQKSQSNRSASYRSKKWQTEWTNPDGSKSQTGIILFNQAKPDGQVGTYGWSNGRFVGIYINNGARFEGKWVLRNKTPLPFQRTGPYSKGTITGRSGLLESQLQARHIPSPFVKL